MTHVPTGGVKRNGQPRKRWLTLAETIRLGRAIRRDAKVHRMSVEQIAAKRRLPVDRVAKVIAGEWWV